MYGTLVQRAGSATPILCKIESFDQVRQYKISQQIFATISVVSRGGAVRWGRGVYP